VIVSPQLFGADQLKTTLSLSVDALVTIEDIVFGF